MVPLSPTSVRLLIYLKQLVMDNIEKDVPDAELPTTYTKEMYTKYVIKIKLEKRKKKNAHRGGGGVVNNNSNSPGLPATTTTASTEAASNPQPPSTESLPSVNNGVVDTALPNNTRATKKRHRESESKESETTITKTTLASGKHQGASSPRKKTEATNPQSSGVLANTRETKKRPRESESIESETTNTTTPASSKRRSSPRGKRPTVTDQAVSVGDLTEKSPMGWLLAADGSPAIIDIATNNRIGNNHTRIRFRRRFRSSGYRQQEQRVGCCRILQSPRGGQSNPRAHSDSRDDAERQIVRPEPEKQRNFAAGRRRSPKLRKFEKFLLEHHRERLWLSAAQDILRRKGTVSDRRGILRVGRLVTSKAKGGLRPQPRQGESRYHGSSEIPPRPSQSESIRVLREFCRDLLQKGCLEGLARHGGSNNYDGVDRRNCWRRAPRGNGIHKILDVRKDLESRDICTNE
jgi:hypothetical protein